MLKTFLTTAAVLTLTTLGLQAQPRSLSLSGTGRMCTDDQSYCLQMTGPKGLELQHQGRSLQISELPLAEGERAEVSGSLIELSPGHVLAGVVFERSRSIEHGTFKRRDLLMWDMNLADGSVVGPVLDMPVHGMVQTSGDCRNWPESEPRPCKAEYEFNSLLDVIRAETTGYPVLTWRTAAVVTPVGASREFGWSMAYMAGSDGTALDPACTTKRSLVYNPLSGRYVLDAPLPECDQYLEANLLPRRARPELREVWMRPATSGETRAFLNAEEQASIAAKFRKPKVELGWIYNEMVSGSDILVLRVSDDGRCAEGQCDLHFMATANCVEPALCRPRWREKLTGNRAYTATRPEAPLNISCPEALVLLPVGRSAGQYCLTHQGLENVALMPADLAQTFPKE